MYILNARVAIITVVLLYTGAVFADDITVEELSAREKQPAAKRKPASSNQYDKSANKWWTVL